MDSAHRPSRGRIDALSALVLSSERHASTLRFIAPLERQHDPMARKTSTTKKAGDGGGQTLTVMPPVSEQAVRELAQVFKLLSDETRLRILLYLAQNNELHVTDLCTRLGQSQPAVSHHLACSASPA